MNNHGRNHLDADPELRRAYEEARAKALSDNTGALVSIKHAEFVDELVKEVAYMKNGGTKYRQRTAELSLSIAKKVHEVNRFLNREDSFKTVSRLLPDEDLERLKDVSKMLNVVAVDLHLKTNRSVEFKELLSKRMKKAKQKPWKLVKVK